MRTKKVKKWDEIMWKNVKVHVNLRVAFSRKLAERYFVEEREKVSVISKLVFFPKSLRSNITN